MEALFTTKTIIDYKEYKKYSKCLLFAGKNKLRMMGLALFLVAMLAALYFLTDLFTMIFVAIIYAIVFPVAYAVNLKKTYKSDKRISKERECSFYEDKLEIKVDSAGGGEYAYADLCDVYETKTNFYLMISTVQGIVIIKENCTPELIEFIRGLKK